MEERARDPIPRVELAPEEVGGHVLSSKVELVESTAEDEALYLPEVDLPPMGEISSLKAFLRSPILRAAMVGTGKTMVCAAAKGPGTTPGFLSPRPNGENASKKKTWHLGLSTHKHTSVVKVGGPISPGCVGLFSPWFAPLADTFYLAICGYTTDYVE